ncbi:MAG: aminoacyl-tRNA hydrolase [Candidatus Woesebacteria bacterium]|jgi:PTH1 family peptidyl-tRNA hydrolase
MKVIIGLGNPGQKYQNNRHNIGFMLVDYLAGCLGLNFQSFKKIHSEISKSEDFFLVKPQTFMNESGKAVQAVLKYFDIKAGDSLEDRKKLSQDNQRQIYNKVAKVYSNLFVIHDDLDLETGRYKIQFGKGPRIHNGLLSIYQHLKTEQFWHVRVGVDNRAGDRSMTGSSYVLTDFKEEERKSLDMLIKEIAEELLST